MAASADKIQLNLQKLLEDSLPLVKKGIFTQQQMKQIMTKREQHQRNILKNTHHLVDFLAAIEYEYQLERLRKAKIQEIKNSSEAYNPAFLKQGKTDFVIIKRIIQLWDRTMRQFRYRLDLWKQYLGFCITIKSRRHFYKALTNALSFLSFSEDLWKIGIQYEIQINCNMWKARRLYHKALRANSKNFDMWKGYVQFQLEFGKLLAERQKVMNGSTNQQQLKFIMGERDQQQEIGQQEQQILEEEQGMKNLNSVQVQNHDEIIWLVIEECLEKAGKNQLIKGQATNIQEAYRIFIELIEQKMEEKVAKKNQSVGKMLKSVMQKLSNYCFTMNQQQVQRVQDNNQQKMIIQDDVQKLQLQELANKKIPLNKQEQFKHFMKYLELFQNLQKQFRNWSILKDAIQKLVLKPMLLKKIISLATTIDLFAVMDTLVLELKSSIKLSPEPLQPLIAAYVAYFNDNQQEANQLHRQYIDKCIKSISDQYYVVNHKLLKAVIQYYGLSRRSKQLTILHRKLSISCRKSPETVELCSALIRNCC